MPVLRELRISGVMPSGKEPEEVDRRENVKNRQISCPLFSHFKNTIVVCRGAQNVKNSLGWHVRAKLAQKMFLSYEFSHEAYSELCPNLLGLVFVVRTGPAEFLPNLLQDFPAKLIKKDSPTSLCRRAGRAVVKHYLEMFLSCNPCSRDIQFGRWLESWDTAPLNSRPIPQTKIFKDGENICRENMS